MGMGGFCIAWIEYYIAWRLGVAGTKQWFAAIKLFFVFGIARFNMFTPSVWKPRKPGLLFLD